MATQFNFNGKLIKLPGAYSTIKSGISNPPVELSYGRILIIDTDGSGSYGGGSGINGTNADRQNAIYEFDNPTDLKAFVGGGEIYDMANPLFRPYGQIGQGVSRVYVVRALTTEGASYNLSLTGGSLTFKTIHEGLSGNGVEGVTDQLTQGFALTMEAGRVDSSKYIFKFWRGTYRGKDAEGNEIEGAVANSEPIAVAISPEVSTISELRDWANANYDFANNFVISSETIGTDDIVGADLTATSGNQLFSGGSQSASVNDLDVALDVIKTLDYSSIISLESGVDSAGANNLKLQNHIESEAKYDKILYVAGGRDRDTFISESIAAANTFNSSRAVVVHGGCKIPGDNLASGLKTKGAKHKLAYVVGRIHGLAPQTPVTFKGIGIAGEIHNLTDAEKEQALEAGVLTTGYDSEIQEGAFVVTQGITTIQDNKNLVTASGNSYSLSLERIKAQLNKEIVVNAKKRLLGNQVEGPNRATLSPEIVIEFITNYLRTKEATDTEDNLIISSRNVNAVVNQDALEASYEFEPNFEINKMFITGLIIDPSLS